MNHLNRFKRQLSNISLISVTMPGLLGALAFAAVYNYLNLSIWLSLGTGAVIYVIISFISYRMIMKNSISPIERIWQAVWHVSPNKSDVAAPNLDESKPGKELVKALALQVYDLASNGSKAKNVSENSKEPPIVQQLPGSSPGIDFLPVPVLYIDKTWTVRLVNQATYKFINLPQEKIIGRAIQDVLRLSFKTPDTLDSWLKLAGTKATDQKTWEQVKLSVDGQAGVRQIDISAMYSKDRSDGLDTVLTLFDKTTLYDQQDQATSYVSMAVHELRTPLTIMRGYIEVFEDELGDKLTDEHREFMRKMAASAQSLTAFVSNILNTARVDQNQFVLNLHEANWNQVLPGIVKDMELRSQVRGKEIVLEMEPDLPTIAIDRISIYEVVSNLIDNAIKYSGQTPKIYVKARINKEGWVETVVQDFGVGMPNSVISGLFTRYYRSHRNKNAISGSGLGLYLVKTIVEAHGGNVWVSSKEGQGSSFGFALQPYKDLKEKPTGKDGIERQASGWIKNHSMYRR